MLSLFDSLRSSARTKKRENNTPSFATWYLSTCPTQHEQHYYYLTITSQYRNPAGCTTQSILSGARKSQLVESRLMLCFYVSKNPKTSIGNIKPMYRLYRLLYRLPATDSPRIPPPHIASLAPSVMLMQRPYPSTSVARKPRYLDLPSTRKLSFSPSLGFFPCQADHSSSSQRKQKEAIYYFVMVQLILIRLPGDTAVDSDTSQRRHYDRPDGACRCCRLAAEPKPGGLPISYILYSRASVVQYSRFCASTDTSLTPI